MTDLLADAGEPESVTRITYDRIAGDYCANTPSASVRATIVARAQHFESLLPSSSRVLVVGAGDGRDAVIFKERGHRPVMLDYSRAMLQLAKLKCSTTPMILADMRAMPLREHRFAGIWASACLYHVRKIHFSRLVDVLLYLLSPRGLLYINLRKGEGERMDPRPRSYPDGGPRFYAFYSEQEVLRLFERFEVVDYITQDPVLKDDYFQLIVRRPSKEE